MSLLSFNPIIYKIHKSLVLIKNHLNYVKDKTLECFFKEYNILLIFLLKNFFFHNIQ